MQRCMCNLICRARPCPAANPPVWTKQQIKFDSLLKRDFLCNPTTETVIQSAPPNGKSVCTRGGGGGGVGGGLLTEYSRFNANGDLSMSHSNMSLLSLKEDVWSLLWAEMEASFTSSYFVLATDGCPTHR